MYVENRWKSRFLLFACVGFFFLPLPSIIQFKRPFHNVELNVYGCDCLYQWGCLGLSRIPLQLLA